MTDVRTDTSSTYSVFAPTQSAYLRLGAADKAFEVTDNLPNITTNEIADGALLYTNGTIDIVGANVNVVTTDWSTSTLSEHLTAVYDGPLVNYVAWQMPKIASVTYQASLAFNISVASTATMIVGSALTHWVGNDASTGVGSLLWSNFGFTQNIFGGQIANLTNGSFEVQGWGETKFVSEMVTNATTSINLAVTPLNAAVVSSGMTLINRLETIATASAAISADLTALDALLVGGSLDVFNTQDGIRKAMISNLAAVAAVQTSVLVMQALTIAAGLAAKGAAAATAAAATAGITIADDVVSIRCGPAEILLTAAACSITCPDICLKTPTLSTKAAAVSYI